VRQRRQPVGPHRGFDILRRVDEDAEWIAAEAAQEVQERQPYSIPPDVTRIDREPFDDGGVADPKIQQGMLDGADAAADVQERSAFNLRTYERLDEHLRCAGRTASRYRLSSAAAVFGSNSHSIAWHWQHGMTTPPSLGVFR